MSQEFTTYRSVFDKSEYIKQGQIITYDNLNSDDDLPELSTLERQDIYHARTGLLSSDYIVPVDTDGSGSFDEWRSLVDGRNIAIPDSVVSRPDDDGDTTTQDSLGLAITTNSSFSAIAARISSNTTEATRARLYDYSTESYVATQDISGKSAGDTFSFEYDFISGQDYGIELDDDGSEYAIGFADNANEYPYEGSDIDIVARSENGSQVDDGTASSNAVAVNDIGNPDGVLD